MIALAITAALIVQTYDGQTRIVPNLSENGCDQARCMARWGESCIAHTISHMHDIGAGLANARRRKDHPDPIICFQTDKATGRCIVSTTANAAIFGTGISVPSSATKTGTCVH